MARPDSQRTIQPKHLRLWLALLRFVTPTLQAAAIADLTPPNSKKDMQKHLSKLTDDELMTIIQSDAKAMALIGRQPPAALIEHGHESEAEICVPVSGDELLQ